MVRILAAMLLVLVSLVPGSAVASAASDYTCNGGVVAPGTYQTLTIAGDCSITSGTVVVLGDLIIKPGAALNAAVPPGGTLTVHGDAWVGKDGIFILGCAPSICPTKLTNDKIYGSVRTDRALAVVFHGNWIGGHISVTGGGGGLSCGPNAHMMSLLGFPIPAYTDFERNVIEGGASISGLQSCWLGFIENEVRGTVSVQDNKLLDPDATEVVSNHISGSLMCMGNDPGAQLGDAVEEGGHKNAVTGQAKGECAAISTKPG